MFVKTLNSSFQKQFWIRRTNKTSAFQCYIIPYRNSCLVFFYPRSWCIREKIDKYMPCHAVPAIIYLRNISIWWTGSGPRHGKTCLPANTASEVSDEPAHPRILTMTFATRKQNHWILLNGAMESKFSLLMHRIEGTFSLDAVQIR